MSTQWLPNTEFSYGLSNNYYVHIRIKTVEHPEVITKILNDVATSFVKDRFGNSELCLLPIQLPPLN